MSSNSFLGTDAGHLHFPSRQLLLLKGMQMKFQEGPSRGMALNFLIFLVTFTWNCSLGARRLVCGGGLYLGRLGWRGNKKISQTLSLSLSEHSSPRGVLGQRQVRLIHNEEGMA